MNRAFQILAQKGRIIAPVLTKRTITTTPIRQSGDWTYRTSGHEFLPTKHLLIAEMFGAGMWYWILYHVWYQPDHLFGEFPYPDPSKWTNQELGIPQE